MTLRGYLSTVNKNHCPPDCEFESKENIGIAWVPPPHEILGIVVSQDPTIRWSHFYKCSKNESREDSRRKMLFANAIPCLLFNRIIEFMDNQIRDEDEQYLFDMLFQKVYWTHLHKCFTDKSGERSIKFKNKNAIECSGKWLAEELNIAINDKTKFIISLGNNVQRWFEKQNISNKNKELKIIKLPHPSGRNRKWNNKSDPGILKAIQDLLGLCKTVANTA